MGLEAEAKYLTAKHKNQQVTPLQPQIKASSAHCSLSGGMMTQIMTRLIRHLIPMTEINYK